MKLYTAILFAGCLCASQSEADGSAAFSNDGVQLSKLMHSLFISACFDTDWIENNERVDVEFLGFTPRASSSPRRIYNLDSLAVLSFLDPKNNREGNAVCTLSMKPSDPSHVRLLISEWPYAGAPESDQVVGGARFTTWSAKYRRHSGIIVMEEKPSQGSTMVRLSLIGDQ